MRAAGNVAAGLLIIRTISDSHLDSAASKINQWDDNDDQNPVQSRDRPPPLSVPPDPSFAEVLDAVVGIQDEPQEVLYEKHPHVEAQQQTL